MTVTPDYALNVSGRLRDDYHNGKSYYSTPRRPNLNASFGGQNNQRAIFSSGTIKTCSCDNQADPVELTDTRSGKAVSSRFWYGASIAEFLGAADEAVLGELARNCDFALIPTQRDAWLAQIEFLRSKLIGLSPVPSSSSSTFHEWGDASTPFS